MLKNHRGIQRSVISEEPEASCRYTSQQQFPAGNAGKISSMVRQIVHDCPLSALQYRGGVPWILMSDII